MLEENEGTALVSEDSKQVTLVALISGTGD